MRCARKSAGFTLLEVVIATSIFALLICLVMGMLERAMGSAAMDMEQTYVEDQVQNAVDTVIADLKETSPAKVTFYQFVEGGRGQTALALPSARNLTGSFIYKIGTAVQPQPVWQCVRVYCYVPQSTGDWGEIKRFEDYSPRSYTNQVAVTNVTANEVILSDGTRFNRRGPQKANQRVVTLFGRFVQLEAGLPAPGAVEEGAAFEVDPELVENGVQDQNIRPLRLTVRSEVAHKYPGLAGSSVITTLTNEVLSRNRN